MVCIQTETRWIALWVAGPILRRRASGAEDLTAEVITGDESLEDGDLAILLAGLPMKKRLGSDASRESAVMTRSERSVHSTGPESVTARLGGKSHADRATGG